MSPLNEALRIVIGRAGLATDIEKVLGVKMGEKSLEAALQPPEVDYPEHYHIDTRLGERLLIVAVVKDAYQPADPRLRRPEWIHQRGVPFWKSREQKGIRELFGIREIRELQQDPSGGMRRRARMWLTTLAKPFYFEGFDQVSNGGFAELKEIVTAVAMMPKETIGKFIGREDEHSFLVVVDGIDKKSEVEEMPMAVITPKDDRYVVEHVGDGLKARLTSGEAGSRSAILYRSY